MIKGRLRGARYLGLVSGRRGEPDTHEKLIALANREWLEKGRRPPPAERPMTAREHNARILRKAAGLTSSDDADADAYRRAKGV
jgi:hypothetical protein